ncbi:hypothetical protein [Pseudopedobacter beijingensis]|uniref:Uncharacterized protein n=1 Tax=Pseudopedobacter beijingensis TaxID=1207056 RepID=A0ABW4IBF4_9SPHI
MKNRKLLLLLFCYLAITACKDSLKDLNNTKKPSDLRYASATNIREGEGIKTKPPTVQTGGLIPEFELVSIRKKDGTILDNSYLQHVSISGIKTVNINVTPVEGVVDENGQLITSVEAINSANNGVITVNAGNNFPVGDYYFAIRVNTENEGVKYSTVFDDAFHLHIAPLLPANLIYTPKNQNLVYGDPNSKTSDPLIPNSNPDVYFELGDHTDKLSINKETGAISLSPNYAFSGRESLNPTVKVISNISGEISVFEGKLTTVITDVPETMPLETIYFFYPTLYTSGASPTGGTGYGVQVNKAGNAYGIFGAVRNSAGRYLNAPTERPTTNTAQTVIETQTYENPNPQTTQPFSAWMVTSTQDLTAFQYGHNLSFTYYYQGSWLRYMNDGRTPTDLEVYISTDYTGGNIQDANGNWVNGTWTKVNADMKCRRSDGTTTVGSSAYSTGAPWGAEFIGTPYPGDQTGADPDGKKRPGYTFSNKWVQCTYEISPAQISKNFTVAFKVASYFDQTLLNAAPILGRGGIYFISDFYYKAVEQN